MSEKGGDSGACISQKDRKKRSLYNFSDARKMARGHGFSNKQEFLDYDCPGAYQLPKNPDQVWATEWKDWDDWLGVIWEPFTVARDIARKLDVKTEEEYLDLFQSKKLSDDEDASRLPFRPDLYYKNDWKGWEDFLGSDSDSS